LIELYEYLEGESIECSVNDDEISFLFEEQVPFVFLCTDSMSFEKVLFETTGSEEHLKKIDYQPNEFDIAGSEEAYYESKNIPYIIPEQREGRDELVYNIDSQHFVEYGQLKGVLHNHTNYSDGLNTLKEMADYAKSQHFQYLGICDHSKSAGYARGLDEDRVLQQMREIDDLNSKMAPFKIFKGIESDILSDGSLDYDDSFLSKFDFVVASIHSNLNMSEEKAHERLIKAIENPYTTILGHLTGRLLLMRSGYPVNHEYIIDACAANHVCIELNAHPYRLDMDWTWIQYAQNKGVLMSINPDAHEKMGYHDMYFGTIAARKGGLLTKNTLNAFTLVDFENYLLNRRKIKQL
jgi:DNA polymerase (family 10)